MTQMSKDGTTSGQKRAVIYARVSKEDQKNPSLSIEQQLADGKRKAKDNGWNLVYDPLVDRNKSGKLPARQWLPSNYTGNQFRPAFTKLIELIEAQRIDLVIVRKLDRLNRSLANQSVMIGLMTKNKVSIAATHENLPLITDAAGVFTMALIAAVAEFELTKTVENVKAAKNYAKQNDLKMMAGKNCAGYKDGKKGEVLVDEASKPAIEKLFQMFSQGLPLKTICDFLNINYPDSHSCLGTKWYHSSVRKVIESPRYIGKKYNDDGELIATKVFPRIVDEDLWYKCQRRLNNHKQVHFRGKAVPSLLSGLLKCGYCNENMVTYSRIENGKKIGREYKCLGKHEIDKYPSSLQEQVVIELIDLLLLTADTPDNREDKNNERNEVELQIEQLEKRHNDLTDSYSEGKISIDLFVETGKKLKAKQEAAKAKLELLNARRNSVLDVKRIASKMKMATSLTFDEKRSLLQSTIEWIKIYNNHIIVQRVVPDKKTLEEIYYGKGDKSMIPTPRGMKAEDYRKKISAMIENPEPFFQYTFPIMLRQDSSNSKSRPKHCFLPMGYGCSKEAAIVFQFHIQQNRSPDWSQMVTKGVFWHKDRSKMPSSKRCTKCGLTKGIEEFIKVEKNSDGRHGRCRNCDKTYRAERMMPRQEGGLTRHNIN